MSIFTTAIKRYQRITPKQFILAGVFSLAFAASIAGGFAAKQYSSASDVRDCGGSSLNSIDNQNLNGGCGALTPAEFIKDVKGNKPSDLQSIYADAKLGSLTADKYARFEKEARPGVIKRNGDLVVDGEVVMTDAWTAGRTTLGGKQRTPITLGGKTYYHSAPDMSFASGVQQLDVMVLFDKDGTVEFAVMEACGNPITTGKKVKSTAECKALNKTPVAGKDNTYNFTTTVPVTGLAKVVKVEYYIDGELFKTEANPSTPVTKTFTKDSTVTTKVYVSLPGKQQRIIESVNCKQKIVVKKKEVFYACKALLVTSKDNRTFHFAVKTDQSPSVVVKSADFTLDGKTTVTGVTDRDENGDIARNYTFTDTVEHKVSAKVNFVVDGKTVQSTQTCEGKATSEKTPECPEKPGSGFPPGDARCKETPKTELFDTGPTGAAGLFVGVSAVGAIGHRLMAGRRARRSQ